MYAKQLGTLLEFMLKENLPALIKGAPGIGKSDVVEQACREIGYKLIISHPVVADPTDYKGLPFAVGDEAKFLPFGDLKLLLETTEPLVYFLDDLGQATPAVQSAVMQLLLARQINGHVISPEVRFLAATNRREDRANVSGILEPVKSRFASIVELEVSVPDWVEWAWKHNMPGELVSFIQFRPGLLNDFKATRDIENSPCPRTVAFVGKMLRAGIPQTIKFETISGAAGEAFATEFIAYTNVYMELPTVAEIIDDPDSAKLPENVSGKYAIMGAIAGEMDVPNIKPLLRYLKRLGDEMTVAALKNVAMKNPKVCATREFVNWATANGDLFML